MQAMQAHLPELLLFSIELGAQDMWYTDTDIGLLYMTWAYLCSAFLIILASLQLSRLYNSSADTLYDDMKLLSLFSFMSRLHTFGYVAIYVVWYI